jgi:hypothetical protein
MSAQQNVSRHQTLPAVLVATVTALAIGLTPPAPAHGVVAPQEVCSGPGIASGTCKSRATQPIPGHLTESWRSNPRGSRHRKIEIAQRRAERKAALRKAINSETGSGSASPTTRTEDTGPAKGTVQHRTHTGTRRPDTNGDSDQ